MLNCTKLDDKVDTVLYYKINPFPKEKVQIMIKNSSSKAIQTKELLEKCFNGEHTPQKKLESANLRSLLLKEIRIFQDLLFEYEEYNDDLILNKIKYHLSNKSAFTAFKRWIIRDSEYLKTKFEQYIRDGSNI